MTNYQISVVVPVYNCEKYLRQSINSLIQQTIFESIQFIFIDDGSSDNSVKIIEEYTYLYKNMYLFSQENKGVSSARNYGISKATGRYISFFDADDIALPSLYEKLYKLISENDADISIVDYSMVFENGEKKKHRISLNKVWSESASALKDFFSSNLICTNPVDKMFDSHSLKGIFFPEGYSIGEDMFYVYNAIKKSKKIVLDSNESLYEYILHSDSAMKQKFSKKHFDSVKLSEEIMDDCKNDIELYNFAYANYIHEICKMIGLMYNSKVQRVYSNESKYYINILRKYRLRYAKRYLSKKHCMALMIMKISPKLYCVLYKILKVG